MDQSLDTTTRADLATADRLVEFTDAWLQNRRLSVRTREAYRDDVLRFIDWCGRVGLDPLAARFTHINTYTRDLESTINGRTGRPAAPTSVARRISAVSSWYGYLVALSIIPIHPALGADRVHVDKDDSTTTTFTKDDAAEMLAVAHLDESFPGNLGYLIARLLVDLGLRVSELVRLDFGDFGYSDGHRTVRLLMKGGKSRTRSLPPPSIAALDAYCAERSEREGTDTNDLNGPLLVAADGYTPTRFDVYRFVKRLARRAEVPGWETITPHSFRHAWNGTARDAGAALEHRQYAMGHVDPRTTQRYDKMRDDLNSDPSYLVARAVGGR